MKLSQDAHRNPYLKTILDRFSEEELTAIGMSELYDIILAFLHTTSISEWIKQDEFRSFSVITSEEGSVANSADVNCLMLGVNTTINEAIVRSVALSNDDAAYGAMNDIIKRAHRQQCWLDSGRNANGREV